MSTVTAPSIQTTPSSARDSARTTESSTEDLRPGPLDLPFHRGEVQAKWWNLASWAGTRWSWSKATW